MRAGSLLLVALLPLAALAGPDKPPKPRPPSPEERANALVQALKNHPKEDQRADAAEALADFDGARFFEVVPALSEALAKDSSAAVRRAAARALGDVKPRSPDALSALEQAAEHDESWRVRQVAKLAKFGYRVEEPKPAKENKAAKPATPRAEPKASRVRPEPSDAGVSWPMPKPPTGGPFTLPLPPKGKPTPAEATDAPILIAPGKP